MRNILFVNSSPRGADSYSQRVGEQVVEGLRRRHPEAEVTRRDVGRNPLPHIGAEYVGALGGAADAAALEQSEKLLAELFAAEVVVIAAPMHNFGPPSALKAWVDHVVRARRTFAYGPDGPRGLLEGKRAILVLASAGVYSEGPAKALDFLEPYLRAVLGFIGITEVSTVRVEGLAMGAEGALAVAEAAAARVVD